MAFARIQKIIYEEWVETFRRISPYSGIRKTLRKLRSRGLKTAVLSDYPVDSKLKYLGLDGLWDCAFSSEETGYLKPHPRAFLRLADRLELPTHKILYVGNTYAIDIVGARRAGMRTAYLSRSIIRRALSDIQFAGYGGFFGLVMNRFSLPELTWEHS
jgi:putative hydrolase of the HAD superfamily